MNDVPSHDNEASRIERFSKTKSKPAINNHHHFGVPVYVLNNDMQSGKKIGKWLPRARLGIYLGKSPRHASSVSLVLNPRTGNVSPQFHLKFDDTFMTVSGINDDSNAIWKEKCGFTTNKSQSKPKTKAKTTNKEVFEETQQQNDEPDHVNEFTYDDNEQHDAGPDIIHLEENGGDLLQNMRVPEVIPTRRSTRSWKP